MVKTIVLSKNKDCITFIDNATRVFIGADKVTIKISSVDGSGSQLACYYTPEITLFAFKKFYESIGKVNIFKFPSDEEIKKELLETEEHWHHATGKKTKGYGGS